MQPPNFGPMFNIHGSTRMQSRPYSPPPDTESCDGEKDRPG
jgi:hypothetical protein